MADSPLIREYLHSPHSEERIAILQKIRESGSSVPISLCSDLMKIKLHHDEHIAILRASNAKQRLVFEDYLTSQLMNWDQNVAAAALWEWATRTDCIMWHRTLALGGSPHSTQRIRYTLVDLAWYGGGYSLIDNLVDSEGMEEMSVAYHALMCFRALQFGVKSERLVNLAKESLQEGSASAPEKTMPYYLAYLLRFAPDWAGLQKTQQSMGGVWTQFLRNLADEKSVEKDLKTVLGVNAKEPKKGDAKTILRCWPALWDRHLVKADHLRFLFSAIAQNKIPELSEQSWEFFAGIPQATIVESLKTCDDPRTTALMLNVCGSLLDFTAQSDMINVLRETLKKSDDPTTLISSLLPRYSALLNAGGSASTFSRIFEERQKTTEEFLAGRDLELPSLGIWEKEFAPDEASRQSFFALAYHGKKIDEPTGQDLWSMMSRAWMKPTQDKIDPLSQLARQAPPLFQICFIDTLGRFKGMDGAALKLLDFIRSNEESVLRAVIYALQGIGTVRASQELVAFLTRPNINQTLQLEIAQLLKELDVTHLQAELRSALNDLNYRTTTDNLLIELRDAISVLLMVEENVKGVPKEGGGDLPTTIDLDRMLEQKIKRYHQLSSEVKRALRTAQFFQIQVEQMGADLSTIDLSPAIDMQYKALELCFREKFEDACSEVLKHGTLQRKLDIIGYARPIPQAMDDFEAYIEGLPIIHTIPFFSRFKLRKMLRAICQFRPGKRFTLDGLKAFALFFICFSRRECRFGLAGMFPIPQMTTDQLFHYCKELHIFQDFRNRAAHEGFHPDASNNLDSIWASTAEILDGMFLISDGLKDFSRKPQPFQKSS